MEYTKLLLHFDEDPFTDSSNQSHTINQSGTQPVLRSAAQSMFGGYSGLYDGADTWLTAPDSDDWHLVGGNFTIEAWIRWTTMDSTCIASQRVDGSHMWRFYWHDSNDTLRFDAYDGATSIWKSESWVPVIDTWYHVAAVKSGNDYYLFVNGNQLGTPTTDADVISNLAAPLLIGRDADAALVHFGYMDELRISKGIARYTSNFTPSGPFGPPPPGPFTITQATLGCVEFK